MKAGAIFFTDWENATKFQRFIGFFSRKYKQKFLKPKPFSIEITNVLGQNGLPMTGLKFEDFEGNYLDGKTEVEEIKPGVYKFD